jgi:quercetin dioxygenase-like cupin family protein
MPRLPFAVGVVLLSCLALAASDGGWPPGVVRVPSGKEAWAPGTPPFAPTQQVAVLEGDPRAAGPFTVRVKLPGGLTSPLHTHPVDERTTVLAGTLLVGTGEPVDRARGTRLEAGSFYVNPRGLPHWFITETEVVLQISSTGPWGTTPVKP